MKSNFFCTIVELGHFISAITSTTVSYKMLVGYQQTKLSQRTASDGRWKLTIPLMPEETSHFHGFVLWLPEILKNTCHVSQELGNCHNIRLVSLKSLGSDFFGLEGYISFRATNASFVFDYLIIQLQNKVRHYLITLYQQWKSLF